MVAGEAMNNKCTHLDQVKNVKASSLGCEECDKTGDTWVELPMCLVCGHTGCHDLSKNKHVTKHFQATGHPFMKSYKSASERAWCYLDAGNLNQDKK